MYETQHSHHNQYAGCLVVTTRFEQTLNAVLALLPLAQPEQERIIVDGVRDVKQKIYRPTAISDDTQRPAPRVALGAGRLLQQREEAVWRPLERWRH